MNERCYDFELLQAYVRQGDQSAFADVVKRHIHLVFGTALRILGDYGAAQEVAQNVFLALGRKAWRFAPDDSLPAWLHKTTLLECKAWLRGELRRRRREAAAAELGTTMNTPEDQPAFNALIPLLDEALLSLRETDRTALLLRYCENESLRDIAKEFGVKEDAAQKRIERALGRLSTFFQRRGFKTASIAAATAALKSTATTASAETITAVLTSALKGAPAGLTGLLCLLSRVATFSKLQTAAVCVVLAIGPIMWQWNRAREVGKDLAALQLKLETIRTQQEEAAGETDRLRAQANRLASARLAAFTARSTSQEAMRKLQNLQRQTRAWLATDDFRWPDGLPFTRIPKSALASIDMAGGPQTPDRLQAKIAQFLDLSASERVAINETFSNYFAEIDRLLQANLYATNQATKLKLPPEAESRVFVLLPTGPGIRSALDQLSQGLLATLGEDRWAMVKPNALEFTHYEQVRLLGYTQYQWDATQEIAVNIFAGAGGEPSVSWAADGTGIGRMPLRLYASGQPGRMSGLFQAPPALADAIAQFLAAEAKARLPNTAAK